MANPISTSAVTKRYGPTLALDAVSLEVVAGEVMGFLGPNGAGKSTMLKVLLGFARPTSGVPTLFGLDPIRDAVAVHRRVAAVLSDVQALAAAHR